MTSTTKAGGSGLRPATRRFVRSCRDLLPVYQEMELNFFGSFSGWLCLSTSRLVPGVGLRSPTTPLRRTAWRGVC